jgi:hypothetical protein
MTRSKDSVRQIGAMRAEDAVRDRCSGYPLADRPAAGATRTSVKGPRIKCDGQGRKRRASMKARQRAPAPASQATHNLGCAWHPVEGGLLSWMLNNRQLHSLAPESWNVG